MQKRQYMSSLSTLTVLCIIWSNLVLSEVTRTDVLKNDSEAFGDVSLQKRD